MSLLEQLKKVPDPRIERTRRHELMDMLVIALCAVICGADNWVDVVQFGKAKRAWFADFLKLPNGIASHDTFSRVFQLIDAQVLERVCMAWLQSIAGKVEGVVAIDGKSGSCQAICRQNRSAQRGFLGIGAGSGVSGLR